MEGYALDAAGKKTVVKYQNLLAQLPQSDDPGYVIAFEDQKMEAGIYKPDQVDPQTPHDQDELYVVLKGQGTFCLEQNEHAVSEGDLLFVPARAEHRFKDFSDDFVVWAFFY